MQIISRSVCTYISALPQYLERFAARYANPLRVYEFLQICTHRHSASGFGFVRSTNKKKQTPLVECLSISYFGAYRLWRYIAVRGEGRYNQNNKGVMYRVYPSGKQVREFASPCEVSTGDGEAMFRTPSALGRLQGEDVAKIPSCY